MKIYKLDGTVQTVEYAVGDKPSLEELRQAIGGGYIEVIRDGPVVYVVDDEGLLKNLPRNPHFTRFVGDVIVCQEGEI